MATTKPAPQDGGNSRRFGGVRTALRPPRIPTEFELYALDGFSPVSDPFRDTLPLRNYDEQK